MRWRIAFVAIAAVIAGIFAGPWLLRRYEIHKFRRWLAEGGSAAAVSRQPVQWDPEPVPQGGEVDLGFAVFMLPVPMIAAVERRGSTAVLLRTGGPNEMTIMFMGALRTAPMGNPDTWYIMAGEPMPPARPNSAVSSRVWTETLATIGVKIEPDATLADLPRGAFTVYRLRAMLKVSLHSNVVARMQTPAIDAVISDVPNGSSPGYNASIASKGSDMAVGVYVEGPDQTLNEYVIRHLLSSIRLVDTGWKSDEELEALIDSAIARPNP